MSAGDILSKIPWDIVGRAAMAGIGMLRRARSIRHAERLVEAMEHLGRVPKVDVDDITDAVLGADEGGQHAAELARLRAIRAEAPTTRQRVVAPLDAGD